MRVNVNLKGNTNEIRRRLREQIVDAFDLLVSLPSPRPSDSDAIFFKRELGLIAFTEDELHTKGTIEGDRSWYVRFAEYGHSLTAECRDWLKLHKDRPDLKLLPDFNDRAMLRAIKKKGYSFDQLNREQQGLVMRLRNRGRANTDSWNR